MSNTDEITVEASVSNNIGVSVNAEYTGGMSSASWGTITGTLSDQIDLQNALDLKANLTDIPDTSMYATKIEVDEELLQKQNQLTDEQIVACNSGITNVQVELINSHDAEIGNLQVDVSSLQSDKADKSTTYTKTEIDTNFAFKTSVPTKTSQLTNDSNFIVNGGDIETDYVTVAYGSNDYGAYIETDTARICLCQNQGLVPDYDNDALLSVFEVDNPLIRLSNNVAYTVVDSGNISTYLTNYATTSYVDDKIGDISTVLDTINGESV